MVLGFRKKTTDPAVNEVPINHPPHGVDNTNENFVGPSDTVDGGDFTIATGLDQLKKFKKTHQWDYNLDVDQIEGVNKVLESGDAEKEANYEHALLEEDSPYFEVRAAVRNYDEYVLR